MRAWSVTARGHAAVEVRGRNWLVALGRGLEELGHAEQLTRLACEVLPNGTVIARDVASGVGYVVQSLGEVDLPPEEDDRIEELAAESLYELPPDALIELDPKDDLAYPILRAETALQACQVALSLARDSLSAESGAVILEERGQLRFVAAHGPFAPKLVGRRMPLGTGVAGFVLERRRSVVLADAHADPRHWGEVDALTGYTTREMAVAPLVYDDVAIGVIEVMNLTTGSRGGSPGPDLPETPAPAERPDPGEDPTPRRFGVGDVELLGQIADALAHRLGR
jgi:GAF domain-containing protein